MTGRRRTESGRPAANIRFRTATPTAACHPGPAKCTCIRIRRGLASVCWAAKPRANAFPKRLVIMKLVQSVTRSLACFGKERSDLAVRRRRSLDKGPDIEEHQLCCRFLATQSEPGRAPTSGDRESLLSVRRLDFGQRGHFRKRPVDRWFEGRLKPIRDGIECDAKHDFGGDAWFSPGRRAPLDVACAGRSRVCSYPRRNARP
jgi:hypothetical protein